MKFGPFKSSTYVGSSMNWWISRPYGGNCGEEYYPSEFVAIVEGLDLLDKCTVVSVKRVTIGEGDTK